MKSKLSIFTAIALVALFVLPLTAGADQSRVTVSHSPIAAEAGPCITEGEFRTGQYTRINSDTHFNISFTLNRDLCEPIDVKAAIYNMPGRGAFPFEDWPQELNAVFEFTVDRAGTYEISFDKICQAQQYDIVVGATPQTIAPWGQWHGPLLFLHEWNDAIANDLFVQFLAGDNASSYQHFPSRNCETNTSSSSTSSTSTSTSTSTTSTSTSTSTTTTTEAPTTTVGGSVVTSPDPDPSTSVLGTVVERPIDGSDVQVAGISAQQLPVTGSAAKLIVFSALILMISGATFALASKKSRRILS